MKKLFTVLNMLLLLSVITMAQTPGLRKVTLQLKWLHQFQFAGYYAAIEKGFYAAEGLDVKLLEYDENSRSADAVFDGRAEFGVSNTDVILMKDKGRDPVVLAAIFQHSPLVLAASLKAGITHVHHLKGKKIAIEDYEGGLLTYLASEGLPANSFTRIKHNYSIEYLLTGKVDATTVYITDELYELDKAGFKYTLFNGRSANIDFYGDVLYTSGRLMEEDPELVEKFRRASVKGWRYAMANSDEIIDIILAKYSKRKTRDHLKFEASQMRDHLLTDVVEPGYFSRGRWESILAIYKKANIVKDDLTIDGMLYTDYTEGQPLPWGIITGGGAIILVSWLIFFVIYRSRKRYIQELAINQKLTAELAESELLYRSLMDASPDPIVITDMTGRVVMISPIVNLLYRYVSDEEVFGRQLMDFIHPDDRARAIEKIGLLMNGIRTGPAEYKILRGDGTILEVESNAELIPDAKGVPHRMLTISRDITERKESTKLIEEQNAALKELNKEKDRFFSIIAHDLRNPFMGLLNLTTILEEDIEHLSQEEIRKMAGNLRGISEKTYILLNELLDWARFKRGQMEYDPEMIDLKTIAGEKISIVRSQAEIKDITLDLAVEPGTTILADRKMIGSVILNLLTNAVKFTAKGGKVELLGHHENGMTEVRVKDNGIGIPPDLVGGLFSIEEKTGRTGTEGESSTGLGLLLCKEFVEKHGGRIGVESVEGKGSDFYFTIPSVTAG
ncbi:MAG: hypothetical protein AMXMBFR49_24710 [Chlorobiota bacterium]